MNYDDVHETGPFVASNYWARNAYSVMLSMSREHCSPPDVRNVSDDRIVPQFPRGRFSKVESTADGDVVIVQPSFDDDSNKSSFSSPNNKQTCDWQARSPKQEVKTVVDSEERNPCSPGDQAPQVSTHHRRHTRNLSSLFDAASIGRCGSTDSADIYNDEGLHAFVTKHKRVMSGFGDPKVAHRRLDSIGSSQPVRQYHQREHSAGLEILSAVADASKEELAQAAGDHHGLHRRDWEASHPHGHNVPLGPYPPPPLHLTQPPSSHRSIGQPPAGVFVPVHGPYPHHGGYITYPVPPYFSSGYMSRPEYPVQPYSSQHTMPPPPKGMMCPPENRYKQDSSVAAGSVPKESDWNESHRRNQSFSEGLEGNSARTALDGAFNAPFHNSHHRKLSSFSSVGLGNIFCTSVMSPGGEQDVHPLSKEASKAHHRSTSSTVSFLNSLDVEGITGTADETFLRNLHESSNNAYHSPTPMDGPTTSGNLNQMETNSGSPKLASGGTSKRVRRKCTIGGCVNRVVQGGLCISHGAKRKLCRHPGCTKNVKKSGLCSTHGPARKRCDAFGCKKVAVQGGRCIAHGARKKLCEVDDCGKQAILGGMCKKHHDQIKGGGVSDGGAVSDASTASKKSPSSHKPTHTRGLSIFHEIPVTEVESLINTDAARISEHAPGREATEGIW